MFVCERVTGRESESLKMDWYSEGSFIGPIKIFFRLPVMSIMS